ncbi:DNA polymerase-like protein [Rubellimicrobium mesophilum DSM 19309]|uniref:DNA polymerase-like protein n=1 Tax=Rubellimicrobium mesophilum DSM 19309 TaxID=442562 RepID=A0A017HGG0_9RHOB|nr:DNA polymerase Y family protein [Rubellimicrobium mesophilum]EYD73405.1 DNA polymerase-like protein [Rubellimicrobium mesophilum DSM 19309]
MVAADPPDGLVLDVTGAAHLHGGEAGLLDDLLRRLGGAGIAARAAVAPTWGAAHALARWGGSATAIVEGSALAEVLAPLPVVAVRLTAPLVDELRGLGVDTVGQLAAQPRAPLALRFGSEPGRRLDQALGRRPEPITPVEVPELPQVSRILAEPIAAPEVLARHVDRLTQALFRVLEERGLGARRHDLLAHRVDGRVEAARVGTARPTRDPRHLARLLRDRLERVDPGLGVERLTLLAPQTEPLGWRPARSELGEAPEPDLAALIDALVGRMGAARLYRWAAVESDVPERSVRKVAPLAAPTPGRWEPGWPRPARLLATPEPVDTLALLPDHPPVHFTWRGTRRRVIRADGPERIFGEWARADAELWAVRDYFVVEDEAGARFWLFRAGDGQDPATGSQAWFLHGLFA